MIYPKKKKEEDRSMDPEFLTVEEEQLVDQLKATIYQQTISLRELAASVVPLQESRRQLVVDDCFLQISAEQAERRRYVIGTLIDQGPTLGHEQEELIVYGVATGSSFGDKTVVDESKLTPELKNQATIFITAAKRIEQLTLEVLLRDRVNIYFDTVNALDTPTLTSLVDAVKGYFQIFQAQRGEIGDEVDLPLTDQLKDLLSTARMDLILTKLSNTSARLSFLSQVMTVANGILENRNAATVQDVSRVKLIIAATILAQEASVSITV
ncbi:hypothetical protein A3F39_02590 [Candidatus Berkelbacteria bacterium RIFCSPHIGHO2_12_FULL_50_11]|nr:MAG: hypothetical protein A3F39_02590 [Candidatus Berkelbacteria bacterium RIFCSPHIGHO2_12_FULL_50_11]